MFNADLLFVVKLVIKKPERFSVRRFLFHFITDLLQTLLRSLRFPEAILFIYFHPTTIFCKAVLLYRTKRLKVTTEREKLHLCRLYATSDTLNLTAAQTIQWPILKTFLKWPQFSKQRFATQFVTVKNADY